MMRKILFFTAVLAVLVTAGCKSDRPTPAVDGTAYPEIERWWK